MRYTFNLKKAYDDYYLYNHNTVYGKGERPRSEYVSPYKESLYVPEHNITRQMCYNKLGQYEDIDESPEHLAKVSKALEIIKDKSIDLMALRHAFIMDKEGEASGIEWYNSLTLVKRGVYDTLTEEEWNLLKEVLL